MTHVLRSRSRGPEKLAMRRLRGALLPGARNPPGPLSCGGGRSGGSRALRAPAAPSPAAHLQEDRDHRAGLGGRPVQVPPAAVPAQQLQREGPRGGQKRGWKRSHQETSLRGSPGLQGHPAQLGALRNPSEHDVGEVGQRPLPAAGVQPCHLHQQLGPETWAGGRGDSGLRESESGEKRMNGFQNRAAPGSIGGRSGGSSVHIYVKHVNCNPMES